MDKAPITKEGYEAIQKELKELLSKVRPAVIKAIATARELGDLSENADYHAAREKQSFTEGRIAFLENELATTRIVDISKLTGEKVVFGSKIVLEDEDGKELTYRIVGETEADIKKSTISFSSPIARALIGKEPGDDVIVRTPGGDKEYSIIDVFYK